MESIKQINHEFKPTAGNEKENIIYDPEYWNTQTTGTGSTENNLIILTPAAIEKHFTGENEIPELTKAIESLTEDYIMNYFYYNQFQLIDSDINVYLTSFYSGDFKDNLRLEPKEEYYLLYNTLPANEFYYFPEVHGNGYISPEEETLKFLTWYILQEYANGRNFKDTITDKDILQIITTYMDQDQKQQLRQTDYMELFTDIKTAYKNLITEYIQEAQEALETIFYEELYFPLQEDAEQDIIREYINKPINTIH